MIKSRQRVYKQLYVHYAFIETVVRVILDGN